MPNLPDIPVTQSQMDKLVAIFPGTTNAEKATAYRNWSMNNLIDLVLRFESGKIESELQVERQIKTDALLATLPTRPPNPFTI